MMRSPQYVIVRKIAQFPAAADTWTVVYGDDNEAVSHHESEAEARSAVNVYKHHDRRRRALVRRAAAHC